ncbi:MAG: YfhO family protein, partial [Rikenellaceae bacterium]|nr:YfhO family protein [Rikenellaceae bacterium]
RVMVAKDADEEIEAIGKIDPRVTAVMTEPFAGRLASMQFDNDSASIRLTDWRANRLAYVSDNAYDGVALFSEIYYPDGWSATIDGSPAEVLRADYILRAMEIPAGKHEIVFSFAAPGFSLIRGVTTASSSIILLCVAATAAMSLVKRKRVLKEE